MAATAGVYQSVPLGVPAQSWNGLRFLAPSEDAENAWSLKAVRMVPQLARVRESCTHRFAS